MDRPSGDPIWEQALEIISQQVNEGTYKIWFAPTSGLGLSNGAYAVAVASDFAKDWIETRFRPLMSDAVAQVLGEQVRLDIVVTPALSKSAAPNALLEASYSAPAAPLAGAGADPPGRPLPPGT